MTVSAAGDGIPRSIVVVTSGWPTAEQPGNSIFVKRQVDALVAKGIEVDVVSYVGGSDPRNYLRARQELKDVLRRGRHDLVHAHFGQSFIVAARTGTPLVMTFHGSDLFGVASGGDRYSLRSPILRAVSRRAARAADAVIVPSDRLARRLPPSVTFYVIPDGIDLEVFRPYPKADARRRLGLPADGRLVLFCGTPSQPVKRFPLAQRVVELLPAPGASLITIENRSPAEVALTMAAADALLLTSMHESGPVMVKEALACDLPVVSLDVGDVAEWIAGLDGAAICGSDEPSTISSLLATVLDRAEGFRGRHAVESLGEDRLVERLIATYRTVLKGSTS